MAVTAVDAPGDAPKSAAKLPSEAQTSSVQIQGTAHFFVVLFDDLHPLTGDGQFPVFHFCLREIFQKCGEPVFIRRLWT